jgi:uncharacterized membrane protein YccC
MTRKIKPPTDEQQLKRIAKRLRDPSISHADYAKLELARMRLVRRIEKRAATRNAEPVTQPSRNLRRQLLRRHCQRLVRLPHQAFQILRHRLRSPHRPRQAPR